MAIIHKHSAFEEPFNFRGRVISMSPSTPSASPFEDEADQAKIDAAKKKVKKSEFLKENSSSKEYSFDDEMIEVTDVTSHIIGKLNNANARDAEIITANIDRAIGKLTVIKAMRKGDIFTQNEYKIALKQFDKAYKDFRFTQSELAGMQKLREQASERIETRRLRMIATADEFREDADDVEGYEMPTIKPAEGEESTGWAKLADELPEPTGPTGDEVIREGAAIKDATELHEYKELIGSSAILPDFFRETTTYEEIDRIDDLVYGETAVYPAIETMVKIRSKVLGKTDKHTFWKELVSRKLMRKDGSKAEINFNELCLATFGKNEKKVWAALEEGADLPGVTSKISPAEFLEFRAAAAMFIHYAEIMQESEVGTEHYRERREKGLEGLSGEMAEMDAVASQLFEKNSYGPMIKLGLAKHIYYAISKKDRPIINEDTWMSEKAYRQAYQSHGEIELISHARAYDRLMETGDMDAMVREINRYIWVGNSMLDSLQITKSTEFLENPEEGIDPTKGTYITEEDLKRDDFQFSGPQMQAIRSGAMVISAQELRIFQGVADEIRAEEESATSEGDETTQPEGDLSRKEKRQIKKESKQEAKTERQELKELRKQLIESPDNDLTNEQIEEIIRAYHGAVNGTISAAIAISMDQGRTAGALGADLRSQLPHGVELIWLDVEGSVVTPEKIKGADFSDFLPALKLTSGVTYTSKRLGKRKRLQLGGTARGGISIMDEGIGLERTFGVYGKYDLTQDGVWSAVGGVYTNCRSLALAAGVERDFDKLYQKKLREYKEAHAEEIKAAHDALDLFAVVAVLQPENAETVQNAVNGGRPYKAIKADLRSGHLDEAYPPEVDAMRDAMYGYLEMMIDRGYIEDWTKLHKNIKFQGAGASVGVGVGKNKAGWSVGLWGSLAYNFQERTILEPTFQTEAVSYEVARAAQAGNSSNPPEAQLITAEIPAYRTWANEAEKEETIRLAFEDRNTAVETISDGMGKHVKLTPGEHFTELEILDVQGTVSVHIDPAASDIKLIQNGNGDLALSLDREDRLYAFPVYYPAGQGGDDRTVILITKNPAAENEQVFEQIVESTTGSIEWDEVRVSGSAPDKGPSVMKGAQNNLYTMGEAMDAIAGQGPDGKQFQEGNLSEGRTFNEFVIERQIQYNEHTETIRQEERAPIELTEQMVQIGKTIRDRHPLDTIHLDGENQAVIDDIVTEFKTAGIENPTEDQKAAVYQYANYIERPDGPYLDWSIGALETFFGKEDAALLVKFVQENKDEIAARQFNINGNVYLPEGAANAVFTNQNDTLKLIDGFYGRNTMGEVIGLVELTNMQAIEDLGATISPKTSQALHNINEKIKGFDKWPKRVIDPTEYLEQNGNSLKSCAAIDIGRTLKRDAVNIWGPKKAAKLHQMILSGTITDQNLAEQFRDAVMAMVTGGTAEVISSNPDIVGPIKLSATKEGVRTFVSFHGQCVNPQISIYPDYSLQKEYQTEKQTEEAGTIEVAGGSHARTESEAMAPRVALDRETVTLRIPGTVVARTPDSEPSEEGGVDATGGRDVGDQSSAGEQESTSSPRG